MEYRHIWAEVSTYGCMTPPAWDKTKVGKKAEDLGRPLSESPPLSAGSEISKLNLASPVIRKVYLPRWVGSVYFTLEYIGSTVY